MKFMKKLSNKVFKENCIYWDFLGGTPPRPRPLHIIVVLLPINEDNPHYNKINSMAAMIFLNIKLSEIMKSN